MEYARSLRMLKAGWTTELRTRSSSGSSRPRTIAAARASTSSSSSSAPTRSPPSPTPRRPQLAALIAKKPERKSAIENLGAMFAGRTPTMWTLEELSAAAQHRLEEPQLRQRPQDVRRRRLLHLPSLRQRRRHDRPRSDRRRRPLHRRTICSIRSSTRARSSTSSSSPTVVTKNNGEQVIGVVVNLSGDTVTLNTDLTDPNQRVARRSQGSEEHRTQQGLADAADAAEHADEGGDPRPRRLRAERWRQEQPDVREIAAGLSPARFE